MKVYIQKGNIVVKRDETLNEDCFEKIVQDAIDEEGEWITMNGSHIHLNGEGSVDAGAGGKFNGQKGDGSSKGASGGTSKAAKLGGTYKELKAQWHDLENQKKKSTNAEEIDRLEQQQHKIDKKLLLKNIWHDLDKRIKQSNNAEEQDKLLNEQMDIDKRIEKVNREW